MLTQLMNYHASRFNDTVDVVVDVFRGLILINCFLYALSADSGNNVIYGTFYNPRMEFDSIFILKYVTHHKIYMITDVNGSMASRGLHGERVKIKQLPNQLTNTAS